MTDCCIHELTAEPPRNTAPTWSYTAICEPSGMVCSDRVWLMGPGNLKQLIIKWYKDHPAFAGLAVEQWCRGFNEGSS